MAYLKWDEKVINDFSEKNINALYNQGYVFGRIEHGYMSQSRSLRIDLNKFELSSENRRVLRKTENVKLEKLPLPLPVASDSLPLLGEGRGMGFMAYHWSIGKLGKDFYTEKFGDGTFSANKIKELMADGAKSNFNTLLVYRTSPLAPPPTASRRGPAVAGEERGNREPVNDEMAANGVGSLVSLSQGRGTMGEGTPVGYAICLETDELFHYCYPFYQLSVGIDSNQSLPPNLGLGMMLKAIAWAKENSKKYIYLGSFQRPTDTYKLQFAGLEWFDGKLWKDDLELLKNIM